MLISSSGDNFLPAAGQVPLAKLVGPASKILLSANTFRSRFESCECLLSLLGSLLGGFSRSGWLN